jgi:hypothetical protein
VEEDQEGKEEGEEDQEDQEMNKKEKKRRHNLRKSIRTQLSTVSPQVEEALVKEYGCKVDNEFLKGKDLQALSFLEAFICQHMAVCDSLSDDEDPTAKHTRIRSAASTHATRKIIQAWRCLHLSLF